MKKSIVLILLFTFILAVFIFPASVSAGKYGPDMTADAQSWDRSEGDPANAIDMYEGSFWHSLWNLDAAGEGFVSAENDFPQVLIVEFDKAYTLDRVGYLARAGLGNGTVMAYELWVSESKGIKDTDYRNDDGWTKVAESADCKVEDTIFMNIDFDAIKAKAVKLKVIKGTGGWANAAELQFGFTDVWYEPMAGFTPKTAPIAKPAEAETTATEAVTNAPTEAVPATSVEATEAPAEAETTDSGDNTIFIIIGVVGGVVIIGIIVAIVIVSGKSKKGKQ